MKTQAASKLLDLIGSSLERLVEGAKGHPDPLVVVCLALLFILVLAIGFVSRGRSKRPTRPRVAPRHVPKYAYGLFALSIIGAVVASQTWNVRRNLSLQLRSGTGAAIRGIPLYLYDSKNEMSIATTRITDPAGLAIFEKIPCGLYKVLSVKMKSPSEAELFFTTVNVGDDERPKELTFGPFTVPAEHYVIEGFDPGSATLSFRQIQIVRGFEAKIKPRLSRLILIGKCDDTGGDEINDRLGQARSEAVRDLLRGDKAEPYRMILITSGKRDLVVPDYEQSNPANRRVECIILQWDLDL